ncbi:glycosyltransferase family 2 protein [Vallitalea sediminicola]
MDLAVIIPVYNEAQAICKNFAVIYDTFLEDNISCQYMIIDDGSSDTTWLEISKLEKEYSNVSAIRFARNFGKEMAICAGLDNIDASRYLIMDSDLQHPPKCVKDMLLLMDRSQVNIVDGVKQQRGKENFIYRFTAKRFYDILKKTTGLDLDNSSDFKLIDRSVVDTIRQFKESNLFFRGLIDWVGFERTNYFFTVEERLEGETSFSLYKLMKLAFNAILSHTSKPLYLTFFGGGIFLLFAVILGIQTLVNYFSGDAISGFSTVILLILFTGSVIMLSLGMIGVYISRIYDEVKGRPKYIVSHNLSSSIKKDRKII